MYVWRKLVRYICVRCPCVVTWAWWFRVWGFSRKSNQIPLD